MDSVVPETHSPIRAHRNRPETLFPILTPAPAWDDPFFKVIRERGDNASNPHLYRRLQHDTCLRCQESYRQKFPGIPFAIDCQGIASEQDFQEIVIATSLPYEEVREMLDIAYWSQRHVKMPNMEGDLAPFLARDYQKDALWCTSKRQVDRWGRGLGKSLALDTPIPTPTGWTTQGNLKIGDVVFGVDGNPSNVIGAFDTQLNRSCYRVSFDEGESIIADEDHLWETWTPEHYYRLLTTKQIAESIGDGHAIFGPIGVWVGKEFVSNPGYGVTQICSVQSVASVPVRCIEIDHPRHLYLAGKSLIPTHNTTAGIIKEIFLATTRKRYNILVACPMKAQAQKWYDEILAVIENDEDLKSSLLQKRQAPYFTFRFDNNSTINIFTTGSKSGSNADSLRSQSPKRIRIDEQDLLNEDDFKAIMPLLRRYPGISEFHGSSTPLGKRETFWQMCKEFPDYRELHFPITVHPDWSEEMEKTCRREARTELNYLHEWLAEFGEQEGGCFKSAFVDAAKANYHYTECRYDKTKIYALGVDWNGQGTGTRLRVVEFDPETKKRRVVDHSAVNTSTMDSLKEVQMLNREWHCKHIFIDAGFGFVQDELLKLFGDNATNQDDRRLRTAVTIDFAAKLTTNKLTPPRANTSKYIEENELERPTKPFMVEGAVMCFEQGLVEFSAEDKLLEDQLRAYRVKNYTRHGWANTYESKVGDHDLDAFMLAMLAIEVNYGLSHTETPARAAQLGFINGFGAGRPDPRQALTSPAPSVRDTMQQKANIPSRQAESSSFTQRLSQQRAGVVTRDSFGNPRSIIVTPEPAPSFARGGNSRVPSRTSTIPGRSGGNIGSSRTSPGRGMYRR